MDNDKLEDIKNKISGLSSLDNRMERLKKDISGAELNVRGLLIKYEKESLDVEKLQDDKFSTIMLRLVGKYDAKLEKETEEMLAAKIEYDRATEVVKQLKLEQKELGTRTSELRSLKRLYDNELRMREEKIQDNCTSEAYEKYMELEHQRTTFVNQLVETDEAINAAIKAKNIGQNVSGHLESAENWASYDVWFKSGIISHMAKYDHIDNAEADFNRLYSQLKQLKKELIDVEMFDAPNISTISSTTRAVDFWFDNIFTDISVRGKIRNDRDKLSKLLSSVNRIISKLESNKRNINSKLADIEIKKKNLLLNQ